MKNKMIGIVFILMILLVACTDKTSENQATKDKPYEDINASKEENQIEKMTSGLYNSAFPQVGNEYGYYSAVSFGKWYNILYTDFENKQQIYLCSSITCKHDTDACNSYMQASGFIFMSEESLYFLSDAYEDISNKHYNQQIYKMNLSGENRKALYAFENSQSYSGGNIFGNEEAFFVTIYDEKINENKLTRIDANTGTSEVLYSLKDNDIIVGAGKGYLYLQSNEEYDNSIQAAPTKFFINKLDVATLNVKKAFEFPQLITQKKKMGDTVLQFPVQGYTYDMQGDAIYVINKAENMLYVTDMIKEQNTLALPLEIENLENSSIIIEQLNDEMLILKVDDPTSRIIIDINEGKIINSMLTTKGSKGAEEKQGLQPIHITKEKVLFYNGAEAITIYQTLSNGETEIINSAVAILNVISMNDYCNNNENYIKIESITND